MVGTWFGWELRRHWRSLAALLLLTAIALAAIGAATAGGIRALTAQSRLDAVTLPATVVALPNTPGFDWDAVRKLPQVAGIARFAVSDFYIDGTDAYGSFPVVGADVYRETERPVVLQGRMLDPARTDEVAVTPNYLKTTGKHIGSTMVLDLFTPKQASDVLDPAGPGAPKGPKIVATIVGTVRSEWYTDAGNPTGGVLISPAIYQKYEANVMGEAPQVGFINALIRLKHGAADIPAFTKALSDLTGRNDIDLWNQSEAYAAEGQVIAFEAWCLLALAGAAAIAAAFLLGQAVARYAATAVGELDPLRSIGLDDRGAARAALLPLGVVIVGGAVLGAIGAAALSVFFPIGAGAYFEPHPGFAFQPDVLSAVAVGGILVLGAIAILTCVLALRGRRDNASGSVVAATAARIGLPVSVVMGTRFALEPGRGRRAIPVRPALVGAVVAVTGVVAALTFSLGISDATSNPARYGHTYALEGYVGFDNTDAGPTKKTMAALLKDPDIVGVNSAYFSVGDVIDHHDRTVTFATYDPDGDTDFVATDGRLPESRGEVALGPTTARELGAQIGDTITVKGSAGQLALKVVGLAFTPDSSHSGYDDAAFVTDSAKTALWGDKFKFHTAQLWLKPGANPAVVAKRASAETASLSTVGPLQFTRPLVPAQVQQLQEVTILPEVLAAFLLVLGIGSLAHALVTALRRRRHDIAITRSLGQTPGQARWVATTQATVVALVGVIIGLPLGVALGRTIWRSIAQSTPVAFADPTSVWLILVAAGATIVVANLLAVWPGIRAGRFRVSHVLRTE